MSHIVIIGAGIGGLPTAYELRHLLPKSHQITLISESESFTFIPSLPWVALGLKSLKQIQLNIPKLIQNKGIEWVLGKVTGLDPQAQQINVGNTMIKYDYLIIATGASLNFSNVSGLGPINGYTQSVCNPHHALLALMAWNQFLLSPGSLVVGAVPGTSCFGPAYEFALLADFQLRRLKLRSKVPITLITPEPYAGHLGIGGMANSRELVKKCLQEREIEIVENAAISRISPNTIFLEDNRQFPFQYSMLLPPFNGPDFVRSYPGLADDKGFLPVLPTYQHPQFESIYAVGVVVKINPPESTSIPVGVPKTGQMTEAMGMAVAHNIAVKLGEIKPVSMTPTLAAICMADFGDKGIIFLADPVLPESATGNRRKSVAYSGRWVSWCKTLFELFFLAKMRWGMAVPFFESWGLRALGLKLIKPINVSEKVETQEFTLKV
ncbi:FAD-dependent pyridine nucleotide-disulphide oxidoreductase [Gloeothece citriformis PCC 7424]|uniref:Sulfide-quinone reductase n=1 Tax=Gloeothece citriformis (strain PCC 7424) TaxID=65393 RepID=B7KB14_GLOC7|nr:FAD-dependent oxidoreductase [Gloeothece citriformis]ACK70124.1 FAD-dependent pyridine nucleotide-disulphide oxidoreductase [Gloeothece citriformis PCC 7424]